MRTPVQKLLTGEAKKIIEFVRKNWKNHLLLFSQVKNEVLEVNPDVYVPLKLEEGKPSPLGLFAEAELQKKPSQEFPEGKLILEFWPEHKRSALLGRILFSDKQGHVYRDIDLKGIGYINGSGLYGEGEARVEIPGEINIPFGRMGLLDADIAAFDRQMSEEFLKAGIRTHRVLAIIGLEELIVNGKKLSLEEARKQNIIDEQSNPVIEVRAFGTKARINDLHEKKEGNKLLLEDAKELISQELGRKESLSDKEYAEWFAETLGTNIGLMQKNGWQDDLLQGHNITLDCRIIDLDNIGELTDEYQRLLSAESIITQLADELSIPPLPYIELLKKNYDIVFPPKARERYFAKQKERTQ